MLQILAKKLMNYGLVFGWLALLQKRKITSFFGPLVFRGLSPASLPAQQRSMI